MTTLIQYRSFQLTDLQDPKLRNLNDFFREIVDDLKRLGGAAGTIVFAADVDMQGHKIINLGNDSSDGTSAVSQSSANSQFGASVVQKQIEVAGNRALQTVRRLSDTTQREANSAFLDYVGSTTPTTNTSTVSVVNNGDGTSTITISAGYATSAAGNRYPYPQRVLTVSNPVSGSNYYYFYVKVPDQTVRFTGPYTTAASMNQFNANSDGRIQVANATVNASGGGTGGGGGGGLGGCTIIGTPLFFEKRGRLVVIPNKDWYKVTMEDGNVLPLMAPRTLVSCFIPVEQVAGLLVRGEKGTFRKAAKVEYVEQDSFKQTPTLDEGVYLAGMDGSAVELHNQKIAGE